MNMENILENFSGKNINFLIGSGASIPLFPTLNFGNDLPTFEDFVSNRDISIINRKLLYCYYYYKWISPMTLSKLDSVKLSNEYKTAMYHYLNFIQQVLDILDNEGVEKPKRANIFTTNYDLLFEITFDEIVRENPTCFFNDGSRGFIIQRLKPENFYLNISQSGYYDIYKREVPTINLFKMHGSVSWTSQENQICVSFQEDLFNELDTLVSSIDNFDIATIDSIISSLDPKLSTSEIMTDLEEKLDNLSIEKSDIDSFYEQYKNLPIINPNKWKFHSTIFDQHYYNLIRSFSYEMEKKNTILVVFAFSFADEHLLDIFRRSLQNPSLQVIMISYDENNQNNLKRKFSGFKNVLYYPKKFIDDSGNRIFGDFEFLNKLIKGQI